MTTLSQYDRVQEVGLCNPDYFLLDLSIRVLCQNEKVTADNLADGDVNVALSNLSELDCRLSPSVLFSPSGWFWISNLVARAGDPQTQMKTILQILNDMLKERDCSLSHIMSVQLYISDMKTFAALNESYKSYFNLNPPSR